MRAPPEVSGRAFLGLIRHVKDKYGPEKLAAVVAGSSEATRRVFAAPIHAISWHPYPAFTSFLEAIDARVARGKGTSYKALGVATGKRDLGTVLRVYVALASAERLIRSCAKVWPSYYRNAGRMEATAWEPEETRLRIYDFPSMHPAHCLLMEGWMRATMDTIGFRVNPEACETQCARRGAPYHEFWCTWEKARPRESTPADAPPESEV